MDTKAAFEEYAASNGYDLAESALVYRAYVNAEAEAAWRIWQESWYQSRAAIEIELKDAYLDTDKGKIVLSLITVINEMASHGIRIKGKTE